MTMPTRTTSRPRMHQSASSSRERTPRGPQPAHNRLFKPRPGTLEQIIIGEVPSLSSHLMYALCTTPRAAVARIRVDYIHGFTTQSYHIRSDKLPLPLRSRTVQPDLPSTSDINSYLNYTINGGSGSTICDDSQTLDGCSLGMLPGEKPPGTFLPFLRFCC